MINQDRSIREKLTLFWADHFGTETANNRNFALYILASCLAASELPGQFQATDKKCNDRRGYASLS